MAYPDPPTTPPIPQRGDRATFSGRVDAFLIWVAAIIPWLQGYIADFTATLTTLAAGGANSFSYRFDTATGVADPGPGFLRLNASPQNTASRLIIDPLDRNSVDISSVLNSITASTSSIKGSVRLQKVNDPTAWMLFDITGFTVATGFYNLTLALRAASSASPFAANDGIIIFTERNGDRGDSAAAGTYAKFSDRKVTGLGGGAAVSGVQDRALNSADFNEIAGSSLNSNAVTIPAGTYEFEARAPAFAGAGTRLQLLNATDGVVIAHGGSHNFGSSYGGDGELTVSGKFSISSPKAIKLQHYVQSASGSDSALGYAANQSGVMERYAELTFRKTA